MWKNSQISEYVLVSSIFLGFDGGITKSQYGDYYCFGERDGVTKISKPYSIKPLKKFKSLAYVEKPSVTSSVQPGHQITIHCRVRTKTPTVVWFYNQLPIDFDSPLVSQRFIQSKYTNSLTIKQVHTPDDGYYTCLTKTKDSSIIPDHDTRLYVQQVSSKPESAVTHPIPPKSTHFNF